MRLRCTFRGAVLTVPNAERLLKSGPSATRRRLRRRLATIAGQDAGWSLHWLKQAGDELRPNEIVALLQAPDIVVELVCAQRAFLGEVLVSGGACAKAGARLAAIRKPAKEASPMPAAAPANDLLLKLTSRHRQDIELIKRLQSELSEQHILVAQLRHEIAMLQDSGEPSAPRAGDRKFRRLKREFSRHFHPDSRPPGDAERERRERVFQEFWPIVEEIERS